MDSLLDLVDAQGRRISLTGAQMIGGRNPECGIRLADTQASRRHFSVRSSPLGWQLSDLGSSNGTFVNDRRVSPNETRILSPGDWIRVGTTAFLVQAVPLMPAGVAPRPSAQPMWRWVVLGGGGLGVATLIAGIFLPWVTVEVKLARTLPGLPTGGVVGEATSLLGGLLQKFTGTPLPAAGTLPLPVPSGLLRQTISGMDANNYGLLLLAIAIVTAILLAVDLLRVSARNAAFGGIYLVLGLVPAVVLLTDYANFDSLARQPIIFGLNLNTLFKAADQFLDLQVQPMVGIYLVGAGLGLLLLTGVLRILLPAVNPGPSRNR